MDSVLNYLQMVFAEDIIKIIFSAPKEKTSAYKKIIIQRKETYYQIERYTQKQVFHENIEHTVIMERCEDFFKEGFCQMNAWSSHTEFCIKQSKKGKILFHKLQQKEQLVKIQPHNRKKEYLLEEGREIPPLVDLGIFTKEGKVVNSMYDKYKQINKFIEILEDSIKNMNFKKINIIDFGCGKSYLTFIVYYYLKEIKHLEVQMTGLDLKEEVILKCRETAQKYKYEGLHFEVGDIQGYRPSHEVDLVISLHACDTATDFALYNAILWKAKVILSVPCCQHETAKQMQSDQLAILQKYGIVKERTAALMTDAIRCNLLIYCGYKTQLLEFVDLSHTPKNLLIRAVESSLATAHRQNALEEVKEVVELFHLKPTLMELLGEPLNNMEKEGKKMKEEFKKLEEWGCDIKNSLPRFVDDEEFYLEYIHKFKKEEGFVQLGNCLKEKKNREAFEYAHMLKGVSGNLGLTPIYEIMCEMVEILRNKKDKEEIESVNTLYIKGMENFQEFCSLL